MVHYDMTQIQQPDTLVILLKSDFQFDVGRLYYYQPEQRIFQSHENSRDQLTIDQVRANPDVRFYLAVLGQNPQGRGRMANYDFVKLQQTNINWPV